ncbi:MAG: hypothetical protein K0Q99_716 [Clostridia bacterium]|jgi:predicted RecA/RadA family phage recombinase|nr:hypothetical protein [Clostridia bacterium]
MLNEIKNGLAVKLSEVFGPAITVYTEGSEQDFIEPCFFILYKNPSQRQLIGKRYFRKQPMDIRYYPGTSNKNEEMYVVADRLYDALEQISVGEESLRGSNISHEIVDGVLRMHVEFNMFILKKPDAEEVMENAKVNMDVK